MHELHYIRFVKMGEQKKNVKQMIRISKMGKVTDLAEATENL